MMIHAAEGGGQPLRGQLLFIMKSVQRIKQPNVGKSPALPELMDLIQQKSMCEVSQVTWGIVCLDSHPGGRLCSDLPYLNTFLFFPPQQIWRHGAKDHRREDLWLHLLPQRRAGHRSARPCHRLQLQSHLPPEPEGRQAARSEGKSAAGTSARSSISDFRMSSRIIRIMRMKGNFKCWLITAGGRQGTLLMLSIIFTWLK